MEISLRYLAFMQQTIVIE